MDKYGEGKNLETVATETKLDRRTVQKTLAEFMETGEVEIPVNKPGKPTIIANENVLLAIEYYIHKKPSSYGNEIQQMLIKDGICTQDNLPSVSYIHKMMKNRLGFTHKKLTVKAREGLTDQAQNKFDQFLHNIEDVNPMKIHCFDESSVIMTSGNRKFGLFFSRTEGH